MTTPADYTCSTCKQPVLVLGDGKLVRSCAHTTPVHANMSAVVTQHGGVTAGQPKTAP